MDVNQQVLVSLLSAAIRGEEVEDNKIANVDWKVIFEIAKNQNIYTILYPVIKKLDDSKKPDNEIMIEWKKMTILTGIIQTQSINKTISILKEFNNVGIQVMPLKGLLLREFYPVKELRTMSDADILIHMEDIEKAEKILLSMGYSKEHRDLKHIVFLHKTYFPIELHFLLIDTKYFKYAEYLEKNIWQNTETTSICNITVLRPSVENQILHLCLHIVVHFVCTGFGLRQLCDLVVLIESSRNKIDWDSFYEKTKKCKMESFVIALFEVCRELFNMDVPVIFYDKKLKNNQYINMLIYNIFAGGVYEGVFGKVSLGGSDENLISYYEDHEKTNSFLKRLRYLLWLFFPKQQRLKEKYPYVVKYPILIPIAWVHRLLHAIFKNCNVDEIKFLFSSKSSILEKRVKLFKWLDL